MALYSDVVTSILAGATAGTYTSVGTITTRNDARKALGLWVIAAPTVRTAAIATKGQLRVSASSLGVANQVFLVPPDDGGAPATNIGFAAAAAKFIPFVYALKGQTQFAIEYTTIGNSAAVAQSVVVGLVYEAGPVSGDADTFANFPEMSAAVLGGQISTVAAQTAVVATMSDMTIPGFAKEIMGCEQYMIPNLMTAAEEEVGYVEYTSNTPNFGPQKWPFSFSVLPPLGTPVGQGVTAEVPKRMCMSFPLTTGNDVVIHATSNLNVAITTGNPVVAGLMYR